MNKTMTDAQLIEWGLHPQAIAKEFLSANGFSETLPERFINKVQKTDGCWIINQNVKPNKYAAIGKGFETSGSIGFHIASFILHNGVMPNGMDVCHSCDNRLCVNPKHLWLGTRWQNMDDAKRKGRINTEYTRSRKSRGESHSKAVFTNEQVLEIFNRNKNGFSYKKLAKEYGVSQSAIAFICQGRTWRHVTCVSH